MRKLIYLIALIGLGIISNPQTSTACEEIEATITTNPKDRFCLFGGDKCIKQVTKVKCTDGEFSTL
jgi:hypothetical protein